MRRLLAVILAAMLVIACFAGCASQTAENQRLNIVCTVYPVYDWLKSICGDSANITLLGANGSDIHSYQPTAADIAAIAKADMTVVIGGLSDDWVTEAAEKNGKKGAEIISLLDLTDAVYLMPGGEHEHEGEHPEHEYDEHVWLSVRNAASFCKKLTDRLCEIDSANSESYSSNCEDYVAELDKLDAEYAEVLPLDEKPIILVADRFPFLYLAKDYGLGYHVAYDGCSAETSADFSTVTRLAEDINNYGFNSIFIIDGSTDSLAKSVIAASNNPSCKILTLDSMQSTTANELKIENGFIKIMRQNLELIKIALER